MNAVYIPASIIPSIAHQSNPEEDKRPIVYAEILWMSLSTTHDQEAHISHLNQNDEEPVQISSWKVRGSGQEGRRDKSRAISEKGTRRRCGGSGFKHPHPSEELLQRTANCDSVVYTNDR